MTREVVLLVEDNRMDELLTIRALRQTRFANTIEVVRDGAEALDYLLRRGVFAEKASEPLPVLVLLDLRLPKVDGLEVLHQLRENPATLSLPVAVFTSSKDEEDLLKSRKLHASAFVRKPVNGEEFLRAVGSLGLFWGICHRSGGQT